MAKKDIKFTLDTIDSRYSPVGTVKQLDSVFFYIKITENGVTKDLTGQTIKLFAIKEDKKIVEQTTKINITNQSEGLVEIELLNAAIQVHGFTYFELEISGYNGIISTSDFILRVNKRVGSDEAIESTNEVATLKKIEEYVAQAKVELEKFKELQTSMLKTNSSINAQEASRTEAERLRVEAEKGRVTAETKREEAFNKFEGRITANTEELETARTATTGENFNSIDERIDCEVERINKKIEISFLEQEDKESHVIENTVEGMTTDMIIKGKTLFNLCTKVKQHASFFNVEGNTIRTNWINGEGNISFNILLRPSKTYTIIINIIENTLSNQSIYFDLFPDKFEEFSSTAPKEKGIKLIKFTTPSDINDLECFRIYFPGADDGNVKLEKPIILEGDWTNKVIPKFFEGIKSFGEQENNKISILSSSLSPVKFEQGTISTGNGNEVEASNRVRTGFIEGDLKSIANSNFDSNLFNVLIFAYDSDKRFLKTTTNGWTNTINVDFPRNTKYARICIKYIGDLAIDVSKVKDVYFGEQYKKDISIKSPLKEWDILNKNKSQVEINRETEKLLINGEESLVEVVNTSLLYGVKFQVKEGKSNSNFISNVLIGYDERWDTSQWENSYPIVFNFNNNKGYITLLFSKNKIGSIKNLETCKQYLRENNIELYYQLTNPLKEIIEDCNNLNLKVYSGKTYIRFENSLSGTSSFKAPVNATATISRLNRENKALEEENLSLRQDLESNTLMLTDSDLALVKQNVDMDFRLMEVEFALDIPQAILSSDINFKNKKGEVKTMARTPYEMMKIVILSGDYDREDYMHKVGKYYERGRMTKEEHDELMSLMTADEVISN
ncbi:TPA: BppU family phage baseplate upper protein [Clostridium perfringens]